MGELDFPPACLQCGRPLNNPYGDGDYHGPWWAPFGRSDRLFRATCCDAIVEFQQTNQTWRLYPGVESERKRLATSATGRHPAAVPDARLPGEGSQTERQPVR